MPSIPWGPWAGGHFQVDTSRHVFYVTLLAEQRTAAPDSQRKLPPAAGGGHRREVKRPMGRYRKYKSDKALREMVEAYFASISRTRVVTEMINTNCKDAWGHWIYEQKEVKNDLGEAVTIREYPVPPTRTGLCRYLGISLQTWDNYCDNERNPQFKETTAWAKERFLDYLEQEMLTRPGKDIKGVSAALQYQLGLGLLGPKAAQAVASGAAAMPLREREALLKEIAREFSEGGGSEAGK